LELTGAQWHCATWHMLTCTPCGAMPLRVRVERPVRPRPHRRAEPRQTAMAFMSANQDPSFAAEPSSLFAARRLRRPHCIDLTAFHNLDSHRTNCARDCGEIGRGVKLAAGPTALANVFAEGAALRTSGMRDCLPARTAL
jgi:hypothetical protein